MTFQGMAATDLDIFDSGSAVFELADMTNTTENATAAKQVSTFTLAGAPTAARSLEMDVNGKTYTQVFNADATVTMRLLANQIAADNEHIDATATATVLTLTSLTNNEGWVSEGLKIFNDSTAIATSAAFVEGTSNAAAAKQAGTHTLTAVVANQTLTVTVNGQEYTQAFDTDGTITNAALASQINDGTSNLAATSTATTLVLTSTKNNTAFTTSALVTTALHGGNSSILTVAGASAAMSSVDASITQVDSYRSELGAVANRLDHTVSNLMNRVENQSAAKSRIEDTDFAVESANLAKAQVLQQAGTAMLAQANASGQSVLSLLK